MPWNNIDFTEIDFSYFSFRETTKYSSKHLEQHYFFEDWFFMMILEEIFGQRLKLLMSGMKQAPVKTLENNKIMDKASSLQLVSQFLIS